eukprot:TRINITY_DN1275_c0_g1_i3.p3 TRINITY_DN1275_c0_g1~~TRINITY_DN1275_c0_g1_i3.p3  ORF type:complete len:192 (-),score=69.31 TRINITY_DN1275_c0_g1_i3:88-663(-)
MSYTIYYHTKAEGFTGRAWGPLAMLKYAGKDVVLKGADEIPEGTGFACPAMTFPAGFTVTQTGVLTYLTGKETGLCPADPAAAAKAQQIVADGGDLMSEVFGDKPAERLNKWLTYLDGMIGESGFFGAELSFADFGIWPIIEVIHLKQAAGKLEGVEIPSKTKAWFETMSAIPAVAELVASGVPVLPPNFI